MDPPVVKRKYTAEEKRQLIANLDIEVAHRTRQFESWLADRLENFTIHQEGQVSRIPKQVRSMTMREFGEKYQGNIQAALRGYQKERLVAAGADADFGEIDKSMRKRKWVEGVEAEMEKNGSKDGEAPRAAKTARTVPSPSPKKTGNPLAGPVPSQRQRLVSATNKVPTRTAPRTPSRIPASPAPTKSRPPFNAHVPPSTRPLSRPTSPAKPNFGKPIVPSHQQTNRVPSSSSFNPSLPPKTPKFPGKSGSAAGGGANGGNDHPPAMRLPRKGESMLSLNGSPLANPFQFGVSWFRGVEQAETEAEGAEGESSQQGGTTNGQPLLKRVKSSIIVRRDAPVVPTPVSNDPSRTGSQNSFYTASSTLHSRNPSQSSAQNATNNSLYPTARFPSTHPSYTPPEQPTPQPASKVIRSFSALVAIPTKDGHLLEFDPLQASPGSIDALEGITDSAKKHAKLEMGRLVQAAVDKWKVG